MPEGDVSFGYWVRRQRKALDLTQDVLAAQIHCSVTTIRKIEADERRPSRQMADLLAQALQIPTHEREKFIRIARAQLNVVELGTISTVVDLSTSLPPTNVVSPTPATVAAVAAPTAQRLTSQPPLPIPPTPLVGRETEVREVNHLLANQECRLLTITGAGGMGKTRLALAVAAQQLTHFEQRVHFVGLAALTAPEFMLGAIANVLNLSLPGTSDPKTQLFAYLHKDNRLLVLDNIEHLLDDIQLLTELLIECPGIKLLVTSRERLNLQGEWVFDLQGLPLPTTAQLDQMASSASSSSAVALFVTSARRVHASFTLTPLNLADIIEICRLVEGMPLAIELAAAWVHMLTCREIAEEMRASIDFLAAERRDLPARHRSLRATFDHSWRLLTEPERQILCRLGVFQDGFTREAASAVAGATLPLLAALITKSLLRRRNDGRYDLHELIRQFALEKLRSTGEWDATREQHLLYFLELVKEAREQLRGTKLTEWYSRLEKEHANVRVALEWAYAADALPQRLERGLHLAEANHRFWQGRGHLREGFDWIDRGLQRTTNVNPALRAEALQVAGWLVHQLGDSAHASQMLRESIELFKQLQDDFKTAAALDFLGDVAWMGGDFSAAKQSYAESLSIFRRHGDRYHIGFSLYSAGRLHVDYGYYAEASTLLDEGLRLLDAIPHARGIALCQNALGRLALFQEQWSPADAHLHKAIQIFHELGNKVDIAECLEAFTLLALAANQREHAIRLWSAASALRERLGVVLSVHDPIYQKVATTDLPNLLATTSAPKVETMTPDELAEFVKVTL